MNEWAKRSIGGGGVNPTGTILTLMGKTAPEGYLACDGTVYNIEDYPGLADYFEQQFETKNYFGGDGTNTFAVPDLRGEFLRGTGTNSHTNQGSGANVGEHQDGTSIPSVQGSGSISLGIATISDADYFSSTIGRNYVSQFKTDEWGRIFIARPTNTSVLYCIKY